MSRDVPAASTKSANFACPHCGAHATQTWYNAHADHLRRDRPLPNIPGPEQLALYQSKLRSESDDEKKAVHERLIRHLELMLAGAPFFEMQSTYVDCRLHNVFVSQCYTCGGIAIWIHDRMIYPTARSGVEPSADLPADVLIDYREAQTIVQQSARGAAALLRLAVQKLCVDLGEPGKNIDTDIASLVAKGLDPIVQAALDTVRVIGNEAVHPGQMDLRDDPETVDELFHLINFIVDQMITRPRRVREMYGRLPQSKRDAIDGRNAKARGEGK